MPNARITHAEIGLEAVAARAATFIDGDATDPACIYVALELELADDEGHIGALPTIKMRIQLADTIACNLLGAVDAGTALLVREQGMDARERRAMERDRERWRRKERARTARDIGRAAIARGAVCSVAGCNRVAPIREAGVDYCKRHADELGVRPTGKVV